METIKKTLEQNPDKLNRGNFLELAKKDERGVPMSNGVHKVKLLRGEPATKENYNTKKLEEGLNLFFEENGVEKKYFIPTYVSDKNSDNYGKFHYLYEKFAEIEEGAELEMKYVKKGMRGYIDVRLQGQAENTESEEEISVIDEEEIKASDIPW